MISAMKQTIKHIIKICDQLRGFPSNPISLQETDNLGAI